LSWDRALRGKDITGELSAQALARKGQDELQVPFVVCADCSALVKVNNKWILGVGRFVVRPQEPIGNPRPFSCFEYMLLKRARPFALLVPPNLVSFSPSRVRLATGAIRRPNPKYAKRDRQEEN